MNSGKLTTFFLTLLCSFSISLHAQTLNWAQSINADDPQWPGYENKNITKTARLSDGYVICGTSYNAVFPSRNGDSVGRTNFGGPFVARYDFNGNLIWLDYAIDSNYAVSNIWSTISSVTTDNNDNIYLCGYMPPNTRFYYNNGQSYTDIAASPVGTLNGPGNFVAKLSPDGTPVWRSILDGYTPRVIAREADKGLVLGGEIVGYNCRYITDSNTLVLLNNFSPVGVYPHFLFWIDTNGNLRHKAMAMESSANYYYGFQDIETDAIGNAYIAGIYDQSIRFYSAGTTDSGSINAQSANYGGKFYTVKYDTSGKFLWSVSDMSILNDGSAEGNFTNAISVAPDGTLYASVQSVFHPDSCVFANADSSLIHLHILESNLYKISKDGYLDWSTSFWGKSNVALCATDSGVACTSDNDDGRYGYPSGYTDTIYSADGTQHSAVHTQNPNITFLKYDTAGYLIKSGVIGYANYLVQYEYSGLLNGTSADNYILAGNFEGYVGVPYDLLLGDTLTFNGYDGYMLNYTFGIGDTIGHVFYDPVLRLNEHVNDTVCAGGSFVVHDSLEGDFFQNNNFAVQLSDANGNFNTPATNLAVSTVAQDSFICILPGNISPGNNYHIRLVSDNYPRYSNVQLCVISSSMPLGLSVFTYPGTTITAGENAIFTAQPTNGDVSVQFSWFINGTQINGAVSDSLVTNMLTDGDTVTVVAIDNNACISDTVSKSVVMHVTSSVTGLGLLGKVSVYPNPNRSGDFTISGLPLNERIKISVVNMLGELVYESQVNAASNTLQHVILPEGSPSGIYSLKVEYDGIVRNFRLALMSK